MPNIASVLKEEISRLARKEIRAQLVDLKQSATKFRKEASASKQRIAELERRIKQLEKQVASNGNSVPTVNEDAPVRFTSKGLKSTRKRLGLSAGDYAKIAGVSSLTIYNFESGKSKPRAAQLVKMALLRDMGKREIQAKLEAMEEEVSKRAPASKATSKRKPAAKKKSTPKRKSTSKRK